jgi:hypothetical protein
MRKDRIIADLHGKPVEIIAEPVNVHRLLITDFVGELDQAATSKCRQVSLEGVGIIEISGLGHV